MRIDMNKKKSYKSDDTESMTIISGGNVGLAVTNPSTIFTIRAESRYMMSKSKNVSILLANKIDKDL